MARVVISQPMFFPWRGLFEQIRLADFYIHYDDVQYPQGRSFMNRVQLKTPDGTQWMTVPVRHESRQPIQAVRIDNTRDWRRKHLAFLAQNYAKAPFAEEMMEIVHSLYAGEVEHLADLNMAAIERIASYYEFTPRFLRASDLGIGGHSSERLVNLVAKVDGKIYITGHGALNYLDHDLFERNRIRVEYMDYTRSPYPQLHGAFNPHVSILDLIANEGRGGRRFIESGTQYWKNFIDGRT